MTRLPVGVVLLAAALAGGCATWLPVQQPEAGEARLVPLASDARISLEPGAEDIARIVASLLPDAISAVDERLHLPFPGGVEVRVFATSESFGASTGASEGEWAVSMEGRVSLSGIVRGVPEDHVLALLTHELVHAHLQQLRAVTGLGAHPPLWFEEGLAELVSGGSAMIMVSEDEAVAAILGGRHIFSGTEGDRCPPPRCKYGVESHLFYRQAEMFVAFMEALDPPAFGTLVGALEDAQEFGPALWSAYGAGVPELWKRFIEGLGARRGEAGDGMR